MKYLITSNEMISIANTIRSHYYISQSLSFPTNFINLSALKKEFNNDLFEILNNTISGEINLSCSTIPAYMFAYCTNITSINCNASQIGTLAFKSCYNLTNAFLPEVTTLSGVFAYCSNLVSVNASNLLYLRGQTFNACSNLESCSFPLLQLITGNSTFQSCNKLSSINLPECSTISGRSTFKNCINLETINLPKLQVLNCSYLFQSCTNLVTCSLPSICASITGTYIFQDCTAFESLYLGYNGIIPLSTGVSFIFGNQFDVTGSAKVYVPPNWLASYLSANYWSKLGDSRILAIPPIEEPIFG